MFEHRDIWQAIDKLAELNGYSSSGLAKKAGLDPTSFNKSKRMSANGKPRWPSTESLAKILSVTTTTMTEFTFIVQKDAATAAQGENLPTAKGNTVPLIDTNKIGKKGSFDDHGFPHGDNWHPFTLPDMSVQTTGAVFALEIKTDRMEPLYRKGDILLISKDVSIKKGDRVLVRTKTGETLIKQLRRNTTDRLELTALSSHYDDYNLATEEIDWVARIIWVSQ